jgi:hypothetical protein
MTERAPEPPPPTEPAAASAERLKQELAALRQTFRMLEDVDLQTSDLVTRLAETVRTLVELRATTSLEISASLRRIDNAIEQQEARQRQLLLDLRAEIAATQRSAIGLAAAARAIEAGHAALESRVERELGAEPASAASPAPTPLFPAAATNAGRQTAAKPSASPVTLRFENVDSPATALSLQRFVSRIPGVAAVTGRRYVGRLLEIHVTIRGELLYDDLLDWPEGELTLKRAADGGAELVVTKLRVPS